MLEEKKKEQSGFSTLTDIVEQSLIAAHRALLESPLGVMVFDGTQIVNKRKMPDGEIVTSTKNKLAI